jgi:hypothetical protein
MFVFIDDSEAGFLDLKIRNAWVLTADKRCELLRCGYHKDKSNVYHLCTSHTMSTFGSIIHSRSDRVTVEHRWTGLLGKVIIHIVSSRAVASRSTLLRTYEPGSSLDARAVMQGLLGAKTTPVDLGFTEAHSLSPANAPRLESHRVSRDIARRVLGGCKTVKML